MNGLRYGELRGALVAIIGRLSAHVCRAVKSHSSIHKEHVMRKLILLCVSLCSMALFAASPARAQSVLWVAATGNDANNCSQGSPCLTFQGAINKGSVSQINCLTSGNYGAVTITASLTIDCGTGNIGTVSVTGSSTNAITINAASAATIVLRHLGLNGNNSAAFGIHGLFPSGTLIVEDCTIQGFANGTGIFFEPTAGRGSLQVSDSRMSNNFNGIFVDPSINQIASVTLSRIELTGNGSTGLVLTGIGVVAGTMRDSVVAGNAIDGVIAQATQVFFTVEESSIVANLTAGIETHSAGSVVNVGASTIGGNGTGVLPTQGSLISFGNNQMSANGTDGNFTSTTALR
jgi:hypothetical protein